MKRRVTVPCPRWLKSGETRAFEDGDTVYPRSVSARERDATLPRHVGETYQECPGEVARHHNGKFGVCDVCGVDDWTTAETETMTDSLPED